MKETCQNAQNAILLIISFLFWKTVYYKIQFVMTACNGLLLLFQHESIGM